MKNENVENQELDKKYQLFQLFSHFVATKNQLLPEVIIPIRPTVEDLISERITNYLRTFIISDWAKHHQNLLLLGIIGVHHSGKNGFDGIRFDALFKITSQHSPEIIDKNFEWLLIDDENSKILDLINDEGLYAPMLKHT